MHIVFTIHHDLSQNTGAPGTTLAIAAQCESLGHRVTILSHSDLPERWSGRKKHIAFPFYLVKRLRRLCRDERVDVVDASSGDGWLWDSLPGRADRPLSVFRTHGLEHIAHDKNVEDAREGRLNLSWKYPILWGGFNLWSVARHARKADACIFLNDSDRDYAVQRLGVSGETSTVIPNGLPDYLIGLPAPEPSGPPHRLAFLGSYIPRKGIAYLAQAATELMRTHPTLELRLLGTGCDASAVVADYPESLHSRIQVVSNFEHKDLPTLLRDCQILLFPSTYEGFGNAVLEAMACGVAPIAFDIPGPRDIIEDTGLIVPSRDAVGLQKAAESLVSDPDCLQALRLAAHSRAQRYQWAERVESQVAFYCKMMERRTDTVTRSKGRTPV